MSTKKVGYVFSSELVHLFRWSFKIDYSSDGIGVLMTIVDHPIDSCIAVESPQKVAFLLVNPSAFYVALSTVENYTILYADMKGDNIIRMEGEQDVNGYVLFYITTPQISEFQKRFITFYTDNWHISCINWIISKFYT